ncbi:isopenicillin N synthase-like dioxygenase [Rhodococcus sp. 27YEA15]|uniref:isopenicillin N synthase family dioxygenase n=1 Tax=Rhodococcus sp. 27YEA15 TaxID=3156259 RepID=UPI003C7A0400
MSVVPTIDISALRRDDDHAKAVVASALDHACREIGFFQITGHGIGEEVIDAMYRTSDRFFSQSDDEKQRVAQPNPDTVRGYSSIGQQSFSYSEDVHQPRDLHEKFDVGPVDVDRDDPYYSAENAGHHFLPNQWPGGVDGMEEAWTRYYRLMNELSRLLMEGFARGLGLAPDYFVDSIDKDISMLRAINYPHLTTPPQPGQMRAGAHTDYGSLTIVRQEVAPGGLEVFTVDGDWVPVPVIPGALVVNIGDLMAQWTNDRWISTRHRVRTPAPDAAGNTRRMSLVFFHQPNYDAMIECLPTCMDSGEQPRYRPISSGDHLTEKFSKTIALAP